MLPSEDGQCNAAAAFVRNVALRFAPESMSLRYAELHSAQGACNTMQLLKAFYLALAVLIRLHQAIGWGGGVPSFLPSEIEATWIAESIVFLPGRRVAALVGVSPDVLEGAALLDRNEDDKLTRMTMGERCWIRPLQIRWGSWRFNARFFSKSTPLVRIFI